MNRICRNVLCLSFYWYIPFAFTMNIVLYLKLSNIFFCFRSFYKFTKQMLKQIFINITLIILLLMHKTLFRHLNQFIHHYLTFPINLLPIHDFFILQKLLLSNHWFIYLLLMLLSISLQQLIPFKLRINISSLILILFFFLHKLLILLNNLFILPYSPYFIL